MEKTRVLELLCMQGLGGGNGSFLSGCRDRGVWRRRRSGDGGGLSSAVPQGIQGEASVFLD